MGVTRRNFMKGAFGAAVTTAMAAAMGGTAAAAEQEESIQLQTRYDVDLLIVGGGLAGLSAGIRALELGCESLLMIDKATGEGAD